MKIFSGSASQTLTNNIVKHLGESVLGSITLSKFPDGEIHVKFEDNIRGKDVFLVQSTNDPVNDNLMELLIMIDAAKRASASRITAVIPYFAYARQDRKEQPRVPITAKLVADLLTAAGANRILTMDLHSPQIQGFFNIPVDHLTSVPLFVDFIKWGKKELFWCLNGINLDDIVVVAPDVGRSKTAIQYSKAFNCGIAIISKDRIDANNVESDIIVGHVKDKTALVFDDMSSTGGTLVAAANLLQKSGTKKIIAGITHHLLNAKGIDKVYQSCIDLLLVTDTVEKFITPKINCISTAEVFAKAIRAVHENQSVSSLFEV